MTPFELCYKPGGAPTSVFELHRKQRSTVTAPEERQALNRIQQALEAVPDLSIARLQNTDPKAMAELLYCFFQEQVPARAIFGLSPHSAADLKQRVAILQGILQASGDHQVRLKDIRWMLVSGTLDELIQEGEALVCSGESDQCRR